MAHFWASMTYPYLGKYTEANSSIVKAVKFSKHVSPKEKMKIDWIYAQNIGEHQKAFNMLQELVQTFPDDKELKYQLAGC